MNYILFLRGINVGGKNKVSMAILKEQLAELGLTDIVTYINSGNILFSAQEPLAEVEKKLTELFHQSYNFSLTFSLLTEEEYLGEKLPDWWQEEMARKDVLFLTSQADFEEIKLVLSAFPLYKEKLQIGAHAIFWGKEDESDYLKTSYHKQLIKQTFYKQLTIRNGKTYEKMRDLMRKQADSKKNI